MIYCFNHYLSAKINVQDLIYLQHSSFFFLPDPGLTQPECVNANARKMSEIDIACLFSGGTYLKRYSIISTRLCLAARWSGVLLSTLVVLAFTPFIMSSFTILFFPPIQARCSGVFPFLSPASNTSLEYCCDSRISWTTVRCPCWQARWSGLFPSLSTSFINDGLESSSFCTILEQIE